MSPNHDFRCSVLFGLVANQMGFVSNQRLITAYRLWVNNPDESIDRIMLNYSWLSRKQHQILTELVEEQMAKYGNDLQQVLGNLSTIDQIVGELAEIGHPSLVETLILPTTFDAKAPLNRQADDIDRFHILRKHASGGLGRVSLAYDRLLKREVALKEIRDSLADDAESRRRFFREAEITSQLEHPGVVPVYTLGQFENGRPFYVMRFIRGTSLQKAIDRFHFPTTEELLGRVVTFRRLLRQFIDVCNTIAYAHSRGVLHRDIKPSNIMLGEFGETLVVDWGLMKSESSQTSEDSNGESSQCDRTQDGAILGTPEFMSPEQAAGKNDELGPKSDIYSLGVTLHVLLTGRRPSDPTIQKRIVLDCRFPDVIHNVQFRIPPQLGAICQKAMAKKAEDRYQSATELAEDVERFLADEPVNASPEGIVQKLARLTRRHPISSMVVTLFLLVDIILIPEKFLGDRSTSLTTTFRYQGLNIICYVQVAAVCGGLTGACLAYGRNLLFGNPKQQIADWAFAGTTISAVLCLLVLTSTFLTDSLLEGPYRAYQFLVFLSVLGGGGAGGIVGWIRARRTNRLQGETLTIGIVWGVILGSLLILMPAIIGFLSVLFRTFR